MDLFHALFTIFILMFLVTIMAIPVKIFNASVRGMVNSFKKTFSAIRS